MGSTIISKLTDNIYIIREGKSSLETMDYIAYIESEKNPKPTKILSIKEIKANVKRGLNRLLKGFLEDPSIDLNKNFDKVLVFLFLLKVKLYLDYFIKKGSEELPLIKALTIRKESVGIAYNIASYLKENDNDIVIPEEYVRIVLDPKIFAELFQTINKVTFRSNLNILLEAYKDFYNTLVKNTLEKD